MNQLSLTAYVEAAGLLRQGLAESSAERPRPHSTIGVADNICRFGARPSAFLFEFNNVLYDSTAWQRWLWQVLKRLNVSCDYVSLFAIWEQDFLLDVYRGRREFSEAFAAHLSALGLSNGQIDEVEAASQPRRSQLLSQVRPLPGVRRTLDQLSSQGALLGVLANSEQSGDELLRQIEQMGLAGRFSIVLSSIDIDSVKPEPAGYLKAAAALGLPLAQIAFVGREASHLRAASELGMLTLALNAEPQTTADLYLDRFDDLLEVYCQ